jgi:hypothetical protein
MPAEKRSIKKAEPIPVDAKPFNEFVRQQLKEMLRAGDCLQAGKHAAQNLPDGGKEASVVFFAKEREKLALAKNATGIQFLDTSVESFYQAHSRPDLAEGYRRLTDKPQTLDREYWTTLKKLGVDDYLS